ncbi:MAG TPA: TetR/AcrR family transcriptional regulator [Streptosporangiaceae bacterium]|jgi:AcrR family transcriptional regulator
MPKISADTLAQHRTETRGRVLAAWAELIAERGYDAVSLADVAARVGLARTAIYNYFPDKESLLLAHTDWQIERFLTGVREELAAVDGAAAKLRVIVARHVADFAARPLLPGPSLASFVGAQTYERLENHLAPLEHLLRDVIADGVKTGELRVGDVESATALAFACIGAERVPVGSGAHTTGQAVDNILAFVLRALGERA